MHVNVVGLLGILAIGLAGCSSHVSHSAEPAKSKKEQSTVANPSPATPERDAEGRLIELPKTDAEWRARLTKDQFYVTRKKGTERAFTGKYWNNKLAGLYRCVCCGEPLFLSDAKYESGTGWPSFYEPVSTESVKLEEDNTFFMRRTEVLCARCNAHLGHVFDDGPPPTGLRYCMNSAALEFEQRPAEADPLTK